MVDSYENSGTHQPIKDQISGLSEMLIEGETTFFIDSDVSAIASSILRPTPPAHHSPDEMLDQRKTSTKNISIEKVPNIG
jgi:hypothetical protein